MISEVNINTNLLTWAISRAGFELQTFIEKNPSVQLWLKGEKKPTVKQLEAFSKKVYLPFGFFFLTEPPREKLPIPFFRSIAENAKVININIYDTIILMQQRQDWLRNYLKENEFEPLHFVGKYRNKTNVNEIVEDIRNTLALSKTWASNFKTWQAAQDHLLNHIEDNRIITVFNSVVANNNYRKIPIEECRGFVLVDKMAPFMFINNADWKSAQMFTIAHELAHIWTGQSAGFDFRKLQPANDPIEKLCDKVAAEFLVPTDSLIEFWNQYPDISKASNYFKVSEIVIARRALDIGKINRSKFFDFYKAYSKREFLKKENKKNQGGDFYSTTKKRLSMTFAFHIIQAVKSGNLLYREAYRLTNLKGDTFQNFFSKNF